jgi:hypothetical protein
MGGFASRRGRRAGLVIGVVVLVTACGGTTSSPATSSAPIPETSASAEPSGAAPATASPAASTSESASPAVAARKLCAKEFDACPLPEGTYRAAPFEPGFTFTIEGDDWTNVRAWPHGGGVTYADGAFFWMTGAVKGILDDKPVKIGSKPEDMVAYLNRPDDWVVAKPAPITIDGATGVAVDTVTGPKARQTFLNFPEDAFNTDPKEKIRWIVLEKDGATILFLLDSFKEGNFDAVSSRVQPVIDSIAWE